MFSFKPAIQPEKISVSEMEIRNVVVSSAKKLLDSNEEMAFSLQKNINACSEVLAHVHKQNALFVAFDKKIITTAKTIVSINTDVQVIDALISEQNQSIISADTSVEQNNALISQISQVVTMRLQMTDVLSQTTAEGREKVSEVLNVIEVLNRNIGAIKDVIISINKISSQTNLLSMNAAIEAAHAGVAGRGFAVVADEIRKLSENTRVNSAHIGETLKSMIQTLNMAHLTAESAGIAMQRIGEGVNSAADSYRSIAQNMTELLSGSSEVVAATDSLASSADDLHKKSSSMTQRLRVLSEDTEKLGDYGSSILSASENISHEVSGQIFELNSFLTRCDTFENHIRDLEIAFKDRPLTSNELFGFTGIMLKHLRWVTRVRVLIDGKMDAEEISLGDHHTCDLGKWIDTCDSGISSLEAFVPLTVVHEKIHKLVRNTFTEYRKMSPEKREESYTEVLRTSEEVIDLLSQLRIQARDGTKNLNAAVLTV